MPWLDDMNAVSGAITQQGPQGRMQMAQAPPQQMPPTYDGLPDRETQARQEGAAGRYPPEYVQEQMLRVQGGQKPIPYPVWLQLQQQRRWKR